MTIGVSTVFLLLVAADIAFASSREFYHASVIEYNPITQDPLGRIPRSQALAVMTKNVEALQVRFYNCNVVVANPNLNFLPWAPFSEAYHSSREQSRADRRPARVRAQWTRHAD